SPGRGRADRERTQGRVAAARRTVEEEDRPGAARSQSAGQLRDQRLPVLVAGARGLPDKTDEVVSVEEGRHHAVRARRGCLSRKNRTARARRTRLRSAIRSTRRAPRKMAVNQGTKNTSAPRATAKTSSARETATWATPRVAAVDVRRVVDF